MSKRRCGNPHCEKFGVTIRDKWTTCDVCGQEMLSAKEFHEWYGDYKLTAPLEHVFDGKSLPIIQVPPVIGPAIFQCEATLTGCPIASKSKIMFPYQLYQDCMWLAREFATEWFAYITGKREGNDYVLDGALVFPKQKVNSAHLEVQDGELPPENCVASIHSHVGMSAFFSNEDQAHFNYPVEMVINRNGDIVANALSTLKCGSLHRGDAQVLLVNTPEGARAQLKSALIEEKPQQRLVAFNYIKQ